MIAALLSALLGAATPPPPVARVVTAEPVVALTFDACASHGQPNTFDRPVFDIIQATGVPVTVFMSGRWIEAHPAEAQELADSPLVELGNHGYAHLHLPSLPRAKMADEIDRTEALILGLGKPSVALRPPFGEWSPAVLAAASERGLRVVLWDVVSADAGGHVAPARMIDEVLTRAKPGSIVIFHINGRGPFTKDALPAIIYGLQARGLRFVTLSELLTGPQAHVIPAPRYRRGIRLRTGTRPGAQPAPTSPPLPPLEGAHAVPPG